MSTRGTRRPTLVLIFSLFIGASFSSCSTAKLRSAQFGGAGAGPATDADAAGGGGLVHARAILAPPQLTPAIFLLRAGALDWRPALLI